MNSHLTQNLNRKKHAFRSKRPIIAFVAEIMPINVGHISDEPGVQKFLLGEGYYTRMKESGNFLFLASKTVFLIINSMFVNEYIIILTIFR